MPYQVYGGRKNIVQPGSLEKGNISDVFRGLYNQFTFSEVK